MKEQIVGVGPYPKPWPRGPQYDAGLLTNGDTRNVIDKYRYWSNESIKADLDKTRSNLHVAIENWQNDFNIGTIIRNANAFNVAAVHIIGRRHYNRRGAMVTDKYMNIFFHESVKDFAELMAADKRQIIAIDIVKGSESLSLTKLPNNCVLVFGGEGPGLSNEIKKLADMTIMIEQFGSTRSVNVGVASGIAMYVWLQHNFKEA